MQARKMESAAAVGRRIGVHRNAVMRYATTPGFPKPFDTPTGRKLFDVEQIENWLKENGRFRQPEDRITIDGREYADTSVVYEKLGVRSAGLKMLQEMGKIGQPICVNGTNYFLSSEIEELRLAYS